MWLIACRTAAQQWRRLLATLATVALTVGLVAGSTLLGQQARTAVTRIRASEYARTAVIVRAPGAVVPGTDPSGAPAAAPRRCCGRGWPTRRSAPTGSSPAGPGGRG